MLGTEKSTTICFSTTLRPALPQVFLGHIQEKSQIPPLSLLFSSLYKFYPLINPGNTTKACPKSQRSCLGSLTGRLQQPSATINSSTPVSPRADSLLQPVRASQALSKGNSDLLSCLVGTLHLQHGLVPAFSTLDGYNVVTCSQIHRSPPNTPENVLDRPI